MKTVVWILINMITWCLFSLNTQAAIVCTTPTSTGFSTAYSPTGVVPNVTQGTVNFTCTRSAAGDPTSVLLATSTGLNPTGGVNQAAFGVNRIKYSGYKNSACTGVLWTNFTIAGAITVPLLSVTTAQPLSVDFWGCITLAGQSVPAGTYVDTVTPLAIYPTTGGAALSGIGSFNVSITNPASCSITSIGNVAFGTYTALQATALVAPTANIVLNCTTDLPYTLALDANSGVVSGLSYTLTINSLTPPLTSRGTGPGQIHSLVGTMPANQAGTCATSTCTNTNTHTLTITY